MPGLFGGGGGGHHSSTVTGGRGPGQRGRTLLDILMGAATGQLEQPPETPIPQPLAQSIGGLEDLLPSLFGQAFGPNRGLAGLLSGAPAAAGGDYPTFGRTPTKAELGIPPPTTAPPGFLPPIDTVQANLPPVRQSRERKREEKLERREERATEAGKTGKAGRIGKKLDKLHNNPKYLPGEWNR